MRLALALVMWASMLLAVDAGAASTGGVGLEPCSRLLESEIGGEYEKAVLHWSHGYWTGFNVYLSADCENKRDLKPLLRDDRATLDLLRATCRVHPDWTVMVAAFNALTSQSQIPASRSAACAEREGD